MSQTDDMCSEVNILKKLDHPNIVNIYELYQDDQFFYLVTEYYQLLNIFRYLSGGELFEKINEIDHFSEKVAANYLK